MSDLPELLGTLRAFAIPMRTRFRGITVREGALIRGPAGWGEFSPFAEYGPAESARWLASAIESATVPVARAAAGLGAGQRHRARRRPGAGLRDRRRLRLPHRQGQGGGARAGRGEDVERVAAVRDALDAAGPGGRIRVDANGGWTWTRRPAMLRELAGTRLEYAEQPCATLDELASLRRLIDIPVAADESIRKAEDPLRVRAAGAADIVMVKVQPLGGVRAALRVARGLRPARRRVERGRHLRRAWPPAWPSPPRCPSCPTRAAWPPCPCWPATSPPSRWHETGGELPVRRPAVDPDALARWETDPEPGGGAPWPPPASPDRPCRANASTRTSAAR